MNRKSEQKLHSPHFAIFYTHITHLSGKHKQEQNLQTKLSKAQGEEKQQTGARMTRNPPEKNLAYIRPAALMNTSVEEEQS